MPLDACEMSAGEILAYGRSKGVELTAHQLVRWHKAGLLPRPRVVGLGRGKGTLAAYPRDAAELAVVLGAAKHERRNLDEMAWTAWALGYPLTPRIRAKLLRAFASRVQDATETLAAFEREEPGNAIDAAESARAPRGTRIPRDMRPMAARLFFLAVSGQLDIEEFDARDIVSIVSHWTKALAEPPDPPAFISGFARWLAPMDARAALRAVKRLSDKQLEADRDIARDINARLFRHVRPLPPLTFGLFEAVFTVRRLSREARWAVGWLQRHARKEGFRNLSSLTDHLQSRQDAGTL